jgi:ribonuclease R
MKKGKQSDLPKKISPAQLSNKILNLFASQPAKKYNARMIIDKLVISNNKDAVLHTLRSLTKKSFLVHISDDFFQWNKENFSVAVKAETMDYVTGRVDMARSGAAYIIVDGLDDDIYISPKNLNTAMHRDIVKVEVPKRKSRKKIEGKIVEILSRSLTHVLGKLRVFQHYTIIFPEPGTRFPEVLLKSSDLNGAKHGDKVVAEILNWGNSQNKSIWGKVNTILTDANDHEIAMQSILIGSGFNSEYPDEVIKETELIDGSITKEEVKKRRDFRKVLTFTIDPETAKDFDDAISYQIMKNGHIEIGVHIADVTHYLKENTALEKEAYNRSTSVYLVDRCVAMLPERLSNDLCSLNPNEDKLTFSAVFIFDDKYKILNEWFGKTIIHSKRRITYEEAQERLESGKGDYAAELRAINSIAHKLRKDKFKNGAINFDSDEVKFQLDEDNKPIGVYVKERKDAHMLIEDFMLLANKSVARYMAKKGNPEIPFVYRVHDAPDPGKLSDFALFASELGVFMKLDSPKNISKSFSDLAKAIEKNDALKILNPLAIRTMAKAEYSPKNIGHYGLAFEYYSHFTSPIRRYSDVLVHRILFENLSDKIYRSDIDKLTFKCKHISKQEVKAAEAERESIKYKQVEFMTSQVGHEFTAQISGMIEKGIFVEILENKAEGLIPFNTLGEQYILSESRMKATSRKTKHTIRMGDIIKVRLVEADMENKKLEFEWI